MEIKRGVTSFKQSVEPVQQPISGSVQLGAEIVEIKLPNSRDIGSHLQVARRAAVSIVGTGIDPLAIARSLNEGHGIAGTSLKGVVNLGSTDPNSGVKDLADGFALYGISNQEQVALPKGIAEDMSMATKTDALQPSLTQRAVGNNRLHMRAVRIIAEDETAAAEIDSQSGSYQELDEAA